RCLAPRLRAPGATVEKETPGAVRHDAASAVVCITPADMPTPTTPHGRTVVGRGGREVGRRQPRGVPTSRVARRGPRRRPLDGAGPPLVGRGPVPEPARAGWEPCPVVDVHTAALPPPALPPRPRLRLRPPPCPGPPWPEPRRSSGRPGCRPPPRRGPRAAGAPRPAGATVGAGGTRGATSPTRPARRAAVGCSGAAVIFAARASERKSPRSSGSTIVTTSPPEPARAVRPERCR